MASSAFETQQRLAGIAAKLYDLASKESLSARQRGEMQKMIFVLQGNIKKVTKGLPWKDRMAYARVRVAGKRLHVECLEESDAPEMEAETDVPPNKKRKQRSCVKNIAEQSIPESIKIGVWKRKLKKML